VNPVHAVPPVAQPLLQAALGPQSPYESVVPMHFVPNMVGFMHAGVTLGPITPPRTPGMPSREHNVSRLIVSFLTFFFIAEPPSEQVLCFPWLIR
jgi:hypothetical protein